MNAKNMPEIPPDKILVESGRLTILGDQKWHDGKWIDVAEGLLIGFVDVIIRARDKYRPLE